MDQNEKATREMMSKVGIVSDPPAMKQAGLHERTRAAWKIVRPVMRRTTWWILLAIAVLMVMWEVDSWWGGTIYGFLGWIRENVLKQFPIVPFGLGMLVYHFVLRSERGD